MGSHLMLVMFHGTMKYAIFNSNTATLSIKYQKLLFWLV